MFAIFKKTKHFWWPKIFEDDSIYKTHDYKINYDKMSNDLSEDELLEMTEGNVVNLNYSLLKDLKINGDINTALINKVKKNEWTWKEFFKS